MKFYFDFMLEAWLRVFCVLHGYMLVDAVVEVLVCCLSMLLCPVLQSSGSGIYGGNCFCVWFQVDFGHLGGYLPMISQSFGFLTSYLAVSGSLRTQGFGVGEAVVAVGEEVKRGSRTEVNFLCCVSSYPANTES